MGKTSVSKHTDVYMVDSAEGWKFFETYLGAIDYAKGIPGAWQIVDTTGKVGQQIRAKGFADKVTYVKLDYLEKAFAKAFSF